MALHAAESQLCFLYCRRNDVITPFVVTDTLGEFDVMVRVHGGGSTGQAQVRHWWATAEAGVRAL